MRSRVSAYASTFRVITMSVLASALAIAAAACGNSSTPSAQGSQKPSASPHAMPSHSDSMTHPMARPFGASCEMVPATGMGSLHGMGMDPVVTAASHNPLLTKFAAEVKKAGLVTELDQAKAITVFAPENSAFSKLHGAAMSMLDNAASLANVLKYHIVSGRLTPAELASGKEFKTLEGSTIKSAKMGAVYEVNAADIVCGNISTANATIYVINTVLEPMHMH
ncbi:MAG TPA: fasciclin domain-containing protein [Streptosporangiaceae bacterium]